MQTVFTYEPVLSALSINKSEIYRYLGYKAGVSIEGNVAAIVDEILQNVLSNP